MSYMNDSDLEISSKHKINSGFNKRLTMRVGKITGIATDQNTVDIEWLFPQRGSVGKVELTSPYIGFNSGIRFVPEIGSVVTVGFSEDLPVLLTYFTPSAYSNMSMGITNKLGKSTSIRRLLPGEISINSVQKAEIYVHDKLEFRDKFGDSIIINPNDGSVNLDSLQLYIKNEAGTLTMGMVKRIDSVITEDGESVTNLEGGNALTEFKLRINKFADDTINADSVGNEALAEVTVGTLVNDDGDIVYNQVGKKIVCDISFSSGAKVTIDEEGNINMNEGNMIKPTDTSARISASSVGAEDLFTPTDTQQRAAREGDRITIPITAGQTDLDHPNLNAKGVQNLANMSQIAPMLMVYGIPAIFVPSTPNTKLVGEITQGSDSVFIGSLDKTAEKQENLKNT